MSSPGKGLADLRVGRLETPTQGLGEGRSQRDTEGPSGRVELRARWDPMDLSPTRSQGQRHWPSEAEPETGAGVVPGVSFGFPLSIPGLSQAVTKARPFILREWPESASPLHPPALLGTRPPSPAHCTPTTISRGAPPAAGEAWGQRGEDALPVGSHQESSSLPCSPVRWP